MVSSSPRLIAAVKPRFASEITSLVPVRPRSHFLAAALDLAVAHVNAEHLAVTDATTTARESTCLFCPRRLWF